MTGGAMGRCDRRLGDPAPRWPHLRRPVEEALLARSRDGDGVLLVGPAGAGKTALAARILAERRADGLHVVEASGAPGQREVPLGALRRTLAPPEGLPRSQLLGWALRRLVEQAGDAQLLVGVDDAQHLDPLTAALVHQLVVASQASVVITARTGTELPDAVARLERDGLARRTAVGPLTRDEVADLLARALRGPVAVTTANALAAASGGNPLHLRELCAQGLDRGLLRDGAGAWSWDGAICAAGDLRRLLVDRIRELDEAHARALEFVAFADVLGMQVCEALVGTDVVDALERRRLITVDQVARSAQVRLTDPLLGEVLRERAGARAGAIQAALAEAVDAHGCRRGADLGRVAEWRLASGRPVDPAELVAAATQAASDFDHARAERLATAAIAAGGGAMATVLLGAVLAEVGRVAEAEHLWAGVDLPPGDPLRTQLDLIRAENLFFGLQRAGAAAALLDEAADHASTVGELEQIAAKQAMLQLYEGNARAARSTTAGLMASESPHRRRAAAVFLGPALAMEGRCAEALAVIDGALGDTEVDDGDVYTTGELLAGRFLALVIGGRLAEGAAEARSIRDLSVTIGADEGVGVFGLAVGHAALQLGQVGDALTALEEAVTLLRHQDRTRYLPWCLGELAHARVLAGDRAGAAAALDEADGGRAASFRLFDCRLAVARARLLAAQGRPGDGHALALAAGRRAVDGGQLAFAAQAFHEAVRLRPADPLALDDLVRRLGGLADVTDSPLTAAFARHAAAIQRGDGAGLHEVAVDVLGVGARVHGAEALQAAAIAHLEADERDRAVACSLAARTVAASCAGAADGWLGTLPALGLLSQREVQVASRTAAGLSSRDLAAELFVSVRTVENHLHRVYAKLGLRGRDELAAAFAPALAASEWCVAHDLGGGPSYVPAHPGLLEVEWLRTS